MIGRTKIILFFCLIYCFNIQANSNEKHYQNAYLLITSMLEGQYNLDFKKAVYITENAYFEDQLNEGAFNDIIRFYLTISNEIKESGDILYDDRDKEKASTQCAVFLCMTDSFNVQTVEGIAVYKPFTYNYDDFAGQKDWTNMFVSKMMQTNKGNCHSMPYLYKMIMDELGQEAFLSLAPNHIYIKANNKKVGWYNIELTCGDFPTDAWLMASGYIHTDAIRNGIYMSALDDKQSVCLTLVDLAQGYQAKYGTGDGSFILKCCDTALQYFPDYINALLLKAETITELYKQNQSEELLLQMNDIYTKIHTLGYRKMPESMYLKWLESLTTQNTDNRIKSIIVRNN